MTGIVDWAAERARMVMAFIFLSLAVGGYAYGTLPKEGEPDIQIPGLFVSVQFPGISASDSEALLVKPMETELSGLDGLDKMSATAAVEADDNPARIAALQALSTEAPDAQMVVEFLLASHQMAEGDNADAAATLAALANASDLEMPEIYRQVALFKSVLLSGSQTPAAERRALLEPLAVPGAPLGLLAQEQLARLDIENGDTDAAIVRLDAISMDAGVSAGLRRRATQLIVALGGVPQEIPGQTISQ